ncbi:hypothetical protein P170DRAFT_472203 [Aspergillus steynii IBT 23096]|uniref:Uncharacterized protein n=1 Tax=Aspergillus steynii IBT 23096 TaxID=1392250 RepID=A0A2I2GHE3_9EURO|nr:uncharacterized protein P170DRAFT_472203 [Aspergillus steynii IBT 23096]PLB52298.1 hypothetical protein P170DRAFT_472203 [Aspergillus steynii IBT 23096]
MPRPQLANVNLDEHSPFMRPVLRFIDAHYIKIIVVYLIIHVLGFTIGCRCLFEVDSCRYYEGFLRALTGILINLCIVVAAVSKYRQARVSRWREDGQLAS